MELYQEFGNDLVLTDTGDLQTVNGLELTNQRIIRRLLTNPAISLKTAGDYTWQPTYGAGAPRYIGKLNSPDDLNKIKGLITSQMYLEPTVGQTPPPDISFSQQNNVLICTISYTGKLTNTQQVISFPIT